MANIETDAAGRPIAYDSAGRPLATNAGQPMAGDAGHAHPVNVDGRPVTGPAAAPAYATPAVVERRSGGMSWLLALIIIVALVVAAFAFKLISIDQLTGGSAPKVSVTGGELPKFKVDTAKIDVGTKKDTIDTPTVDVGTKKTTVDVPTVHVEKADAAK